ncbi:hypothetical protein [Mucilaginibacter polytrichastri]|uniref:Uncharacterized protein n=1 Tax=Mucilaginibacter polytrichastri TaxID=1302689 RepID=A0A1Q6A6L0_9SPHI|nr:hypothetical protein [Mucilaginibacter polytrichastri]OKS89658.1 hypothetical protein RG47T_5143 [Mucilaginibacter polytrichastri]SFT24824.1 hypothetical protein SAMN04487890_12248 [Mucilaginibacter polytrichastri]
MNPSEELRGTLALVHHELTDDPAKRQGQIGMITDIDLDQDDVFVSFEKGHQAKYSTDALLVLRNHKDVYRDLMSNATNMDGPDFKALFQLNLLQQSGSAKDLRSAMDIAQSNEKIRDYSMSSLEDKLGVVRDFAEYQEQAVTRGR